MDTTKNEGLERNTFRILCHTPVNAWRYEKLELQCRWSLGALKGSGCCRSDLGLLDIQNWQMKRKKHMLMVKSGGRNLNNNRIVNSTSSWWMFREGGRIPLEMVNYMKLPSKLKSPTVSEVYAAHLQAKLMFPTRFPVFFSCQGKHQSPWQF